MLVRISECQATWSGILDAVMRYSAMAPVGELSEYDADRLQAAANNILIRIQEQRDKQEGKGNPS